MASPRNIIASAYVSASATSEYTANNVQTVVQNMTLTNVSGSATTATVYLGTSASAESTIIQTRNIQAGEAYDCPEIAGKVLDNGQSIFLEAGAGSAIVVNASGVEFSL